MLIPRRVPLSHTVKKPLPGWIFTLGGGGGVGTMAKVDTCQGVTVACEEYEFDASLVVQAIQKESGPELSATGRGDQRYASALGQRWEKKGSIGE